MTNGQLERRCLKLLLCEANYNSMCHFTCACQVPMKHRYFATFYSANYCIFPASIAMKNNCFHQTSYGEKVHQCMVSSFHCIEEWFFYILRCGKWVFVGT